MREWAGAPLLEAKPLPPPSFPEIEEQDLRLLAWNKLGIVRNGDALAEAEAALEAVAMRPCAKPSRPLFELRGMHEAACLVARCALARKESRGAHYRSDYPDKDPDFQKHSLITRDNDVTFY